MWQHKKSGIAFNKCEIQMIVSSDNTRRGDLVDFVR